MSFYPKNRLLEKIRPLAFSIPTVPNCQPYSTVFSDKNDKSSALTKSSYLRPLCPFLIFKTLAFEFFSTMVMRRELLLADCDLLHIKPAMQRPNGLVSLVFDRAEDALPMFVVF